MPHADVPGGAEATAPQAMAIHDERSELSDDSLIASSTSPLAPAKRHKASSPSPSRHAYAGRTPQGSRDSTPTRSQGKRAGKLPTIGKVSKLRASSTPRAHGRASSPPTRPVVNDHVLATAAANDHDARLAALEQQQRNDHVFLGEMAAAARLLGHSVESIASRQQQLEVQTQNFAGMDSTSAARSRRSGSSSRSTRTSSTPQRSTSGSTRSRTASPSSRSRLRTRPTARTRWPSTSPRSTDNALVKARS